MAYLNTPFLFVLPGVETEEIRPWQENGEIWRRVKVTFPPSIATHSTVHTFYFDQTGLLKRHDYDVDISGGTPGAHYVSELKEFSGIMVPTKRRVFGRQPAGEGWDDGFIAALLGVANCSITFGKGRIVDEVASGEAHQGPWRMNESDSSN